MHNLNATCGCIDAELVTANVGWVSHIQVSEDGIRQLTFSVRDLIIGQDAGLDRVNLGDLGVVHVWIAGLGTTRYHVVSVAPSFDVANDPQWTARSRECGPNRMPGFLFASTCFVDHGRVHILAVE